MGLTQMQKLAVEMRDRPLLISAAAGSGKTSVLSKRVVSLLAGDGDRNPIDADRMLIVTFTRAASAELRERITKELEERAAAEPENENLQRQRRLLPQAQISTIHSLCKTVLEQNFERAGLPASFSVIQDGALHQLRDEVLQQLLEENYAESDEGFAALRKLCENGSDKKIVAIVTDTYATACAEPNIALWIKCCQNKMKQEMQTVYEKEKAFVSQLEPVCRELIALYRKLPEMRSNVRELLEHPARKPKGFESKAAQRALKVEEYGVWADAVSNVMEQLAQAEAGIANWGKSLHKLPSRPTKKALILLHENQLLNPWLTLWTEAVQFQQIVDGVSASDLSHDRRVMLAVDKVYEMVLQLHERLRKRKLERSQLAFYDLEQEIVSLLADASLQSDNSILFTQSDAAKTIASGYDCVMVDECQDNNSVQDIIFRMLTDGTDHLFMVGDIKQSIYRFRHARPELFSERQEMYRSPHEAKEGEPACIVLKDNFRSREAVIDTVNYLFYRIMSKGCGEVEYDTSAAMNTGREYPALPNGYTSDTELHLLDNFREDKRIPKIDPAEYTAKLISDMIIEKFPVTDKETGELRPCRYSDFMVLMRSRGHLSELTDALEAYHISYHTEGIKGFYNTSEIKSCIAMLQTAKNPQDDLALWSFLLSPFCMFDFDDAAVLRLVSDQHGCRYIYDALRISAEDDSSVIHRKAADTVCLISDLRRESVRMNVSDFLQYAFVRCNFPALLLAGEDGTQKNANLELLCKDAKNWEQDNFGGVTGYLQYVQRLTEQNDDIVSASALEQNDDVVEVMTIHGSKGLEAPICILYSCEKTFNTDDLKKGYLLDADFGLTIQYRDEESCIQYYNEYGERLKQKITAANRSEEMRLLYVAMTRAKEKLICIGSVDNLSGRLGRIFPKAGANDGSPKLLPEFCGEVSNYLDWLMAGLLAVPEASALLESMGYPVCDTVPFTAVAKALGDDKGRPLALKLVIQKAEEFSPEMIEETVKAENYNRLTVSPEMSERMLRQYPYREVIDIPAKSSVTALSHREQDTGSMDLYQKVKEELLNVPHGEDVYSQQDLTLKQALQEAGLKKPEFLLDDSQRVTGAMRGTATHNFLQYADFSAAISDLEAEVGRLVAEQYLSANDAGLIDRYAIRRFLQNDLCKRILAAQSEKRLLREYAFIHALEADQVFSLSDNYPDEKIVVQGIADCILFEDDGLVLIDYKTDILREEVKFIERYKKQLSIYCDALNLLFADRYPSGKAVKQSMIYSLYLGREIDTGTEKGL